MITQINRQLENDNDFVAETLLKLCPELQSTVTSSDFCCNDV